jgi:lipopolysaccharide export LptBFGC system permease protein LptF
MRLLDRYIARQFVLNVAVLFVILFCFVVTVDVSVNLRRFSRVAAELSQAGEDASGFRHGIVTTLVIIDLWWPRLIQLFNYLLGLVMVGAMGFTCVQLLRNREFLAMVSAGQSLQRVLRPFLIAGVGLSLVQLANQELLVPRIAPLLPRQHDEAGQPTLSVSQVPLIRDGTGRMLYASAFDPAEGTLADVFILETDGEGRAVSVLRADSAVWRDGAWELKSPAAESRSLTPGEPPAAVARFETNVNPTLLRMNQYKGYREALSFRQIGALLSRPDLLDEAASAEYQRLRWGRFSIVATNLLALVIAAPFFITRLPTGVMGRTITGAPVLIVALMGGVLGASAAIPGVPPLLGTFIPPLVLLPIAIAAYGAVRT